MAKSLAGLAQPPSCSAVGSVTAVRDRRLHTFNEESNLSHIVEIQTEVRDAVAVLAACRRLGLAEPVERTVRMFAEQVTGLAVQLSGWRYPVVCDLARGQLKYDNFGGRWGEQRELDRFIQMYTVEKAHLEARRQGHAVTEQALSDGSIRLVVQVAGGAV